MIDIKVNLFCENTLVTKSIKKLNTNFIETVSEGKMEKKLYK
jgi:hypothetical protein